MIYKHSLKFNNNKEIRVELINGRGVKIWGNNMITTEEVHDNSIISVNFGGELKVSVGDNYKILINTLLIGASEYTTSYYVDYIFSLGKQYIFYCSKRSKASVFLLPFLFTSAAEIGYNTYLINAYLGDAERPKSDNLLYLQYRFFPFQSYYNLERSLTKNTNFKEFYDPDASTTMFVFEVPKASTTDYKLLMVGKYSQITENSKVRILDFHKARPLDSLGQTLYKNAAKKKQLELNLGVTLGDDSELFDRPSDNTEIFRYETERML